MKKRHFYSISNWTIRQLPCLLSIFLLFGLLPVVQAQSAAIIGWDASGTTSSGDEVSFVLLRDFAAGEVLYITEDEYLNGSNSFNSTEGHLAFTIPAGGLLENEVISIVESSSGNYTEQCGTGGSVTGTGSWSLASDPLGGMSDELYIYSATNPSAPWSSVTEVHCFVWSATSNYSNDQDPLVEHPNVIIISWNIGGPQGFNAYLSDGARTNTTSANLQNDANWVKSANDISLSCTNLTNHLLPVDLISFGAEVDNKIVALNWSTATEVGNEGFKIEHSLDGETWREISSVNGNGTSEVTNTYEFIHEYPSSGMNYYRLKQVNFDGSFEYSEVVSVNFTFENEEIGALYPNPSNSGEVTLNYISKGNGSLDVAIFDVTGKLVSSQSYSTVNGINILTIDSSPLGKGSFIVKLDDKINSTSRRLVVN